jgi:hypothetical protein
LSGGQSGADRGGLEAAKLAGVPTGGMAPKGYETEAGPDPSLKDFGLKESDVSFYPTRTRQNVHDCDLCLWFGDPNSRGGQLTRRLCREMDKPFHAIDDRTQSPDYTAGIITAHAKANSAGVVKVLVAGNRESINKGIRARVEEYLFEVLTILKGA